MIDFVNRHIMAFFNRTTDSNAIGFGCSSIDELVRKIVPDSILLRGDYKLTLNNGCVSKRHSLN